MKRMCIVLMILSMTAFCLSSCTSQNVLDLYDLNKTYISNPPDTDSDDLAESKFVSINDFSLQLFKRCLKEDENVLISPLSVLYALAMVNNGAEGETLAQMKDVLILSQDELNKALYAYEQSLTSNEDAQVRLANSIWFTNNKDYEINPSFLQTNVDYYNADIYQCPFDLNAIKNINFWVKRQTEGMIEEIVSDLPKDTVMALINALTFDAKWSSPYTDDQVSESTFTAYNGLSQNVKMMYSREYSFIKDDHVKGFIKYYANPKYAFVALLSNENVSVHDYLQKLDGRHLLDLLSNPITKTVSSGLPKFKVDYDTELNDVLYDMGMKDAFTAEADFSGICNDIFIDKVVHKTTITVDEMGTKAGAVTAIAMEGTAMAEGEMETVILDRPFIYLLIDCENRIPLFIGILNTTED